MKRVKREREREKRVEQRVDHCSGTMDERTEDGARYLEFAYESKLERILQDEETHACSERFVK